MMARSTGGKLFWNDEYRTKITSIRFIKDDFSSIPTTADVLDDVQKTGDYARIAAYTEGDGDGGLALTILSPNTIFANSSASDYFYQFTSLKNIEFKNFDTSKVISMYRMFSVCNNIEKIIIREFNTSNVTNMGSLFGGCWYLESIDISNFNTGKVTNMNSMFYSCFRLKELNLNSFDTSNVTNMRFNVFRMHKLSFIKYCEF